MKDIIQQQEYTNNITGEVETFDVISRNGDFNFEKIWLGHLIEALDMIGNQKIKVILHMMKHREKANNIFLSNQRKIAKDTGVSIQTVSRTIRALKEVNFIQEVQSGAYQLNPNMIFKGQKGNRMKILLEYNSTDKQVKKK